MRQFGGEGAGEIPPAPNPGCLSPFSCQAGPLIGLEGTGVWVMQSVESPTEPDQGGEVWRMVGQKEKISRLQILLF